MKTLSLVAVALAAGTLAAQAPTNPLDKRVMLLGEYSRPEQFVLNYNDATKMQLKDRADSQAGLGLRFMGELPGTLNWYYEFGGRLESSSKLKVNGPDAYGLHLDSRNVAIKDSYWMLGLGYEMEIGSSVNLGFHLEGRGESLSAKGTLYGATQATVRGNVDQSVTYVRPWARMSLTFNFKAGDVRPFFGLEAATAIVRTKQETDDALPGAFISERTLKSMAPSVSGAIYFGLHF